MRRGGVYEKMSTDIVALTRQLKEKADQGAFLYEEMTDIKERINKGQASSNNIELKIAKAVEDIKTQLGANNQNIEDKLKEVLSTLEEGRATQNKISDKMEALEGKIQNLVRDQKSLSRSVDNQMVKLESKIGDVDMKLKDIDQKTNTMDKKISGMKGTLEEEVIKLMAKDKVLEELHTKLENKLNSEINRLKEQISSTNTKILEVETTLYEATRRLEEKIESSIKKTEQSGKKDMEASEKNISNKLQSLVEGAGKIAQTNLEKHFKAFTKEQEASKTTKEELERRLTDLDQQVKEIHRNQEELMLSNLESDQKMSQSDLVKIGKTAQSNLEKHIKGYNKEQEVNKAKAEEVHRRVTELHQKVTDVHRCQEELMQTKLESFQKLSKLELEKIAKTFLEKSLEEGKIQSQKIQDHLMKHFTAVLKEQENHLSAELDTRFSRIEQQSNVKKESNGPTTEPSDTVRVNRQLEMLTMAINGLANNYVNQEENREHQKIKPQTQSAYCELHGRGNHSTKECYNLANRRVQEGRRSPKTGTMTLKTTNDQKGPTFALYIKRTHTHQKSATP